MKYRYLAISDRKEEKRGMIEAENQMQAVAMIRENGDLILELEQVHKWREVLTEDIYVAGMKDRDLALFSSQFAAALKAGISVEKTLSILGGQAEKRRWRKCLIKTAQFVKAGGSLADGFEEADPDGFPAAFLEMVRGGEHSGRLAEVFQNLSMYYERRYKAKQKMETSLIYPCFVRNGSFGFDLYCWLGRTIDCGGIKRSGNGSASWNENFAFYFRFFTGAYRGAFKCSHPGDWRSSLLLED